jgi:1,4-dihydroxy-2-naphthoate octaprenyltransferase
LGAIASHICVNAFNEYFDFKSGLDTKTRRTPFSGGSGTLPEHPELANMVLGLSVASLIIVAVIGIYFVWVRGWLLLPLGVVGVMLLVTYTIWWVYHPVMCLAAPGLGFGVIMVMGTHFALTGTYSWTAFTASLVPSFLVSNLLLLNQFPDVDADQSIGRRHFPIAIGRPASARLYGILLFLTYVSVISGVILELLPPFALLALLTVVLSLKAYLGARKNADSIPDLIPSMGINVIINLATPALLAVGLLIG